MLGPGSVWCSGVGGPSLTSLPSSGNFLNYPCQSDQLGVGSAAALRRSLPALCGIITDTCPVQGLSQAIGWRA